MSKEDTELGFCSFILDYLLEIGQDSRASLEWLNQQILKDEKNIEISPSM